MFDSTTTDLLKNPYQDLCQEKHFSGIYYVYKNNYRQRIDLFRAAVQYNLLEIVMLVEYNNIDIPDILLSIIKYDRLDAYILLNQYVEFCLPTVLGLVVMYNSLTIALWLRNYDLRATHFFINYGNYSLLQYLYGDIYMTIVYSRNCTGTTGLKYSN